MKKPLMSENICAASDNIANDYAHNPPTTLKLKSEYILLLSKIQYKLLKQLLNDKEHFM